MAAKRTRLTDYPTKADLHLVAADLRREIGEVRGEVGEVRREVGEVRHELGDRIDSVETTLTADIRSVEAKLSGDIRTVETKLSADIRTVETKLSADIRTVETKLSADIRTLSAELGEARADIRAVGVMVERMDTKMGVLVEGLSGFALKSEVKELDERHSAQIALLEDVVRESAQGVRKR